MVSVSFVYVMMTGSTEWCQLLHHDPFSVNCVQFTADGMRIIAGTANGNVSVCIIHIGCMVCH